MATKQKKRKRRRSAKGPETRDRHRLYEASVQFPESDVKFFDRVYTQRNGSVPRLLKEDFCGTALLCAEWVRLRPDNTAIGVDLDTETLAWGRKNNIEPLGDHASRVELREANVLDVQEPKVDVIAALNFSYCVFKTRNELRAYFESARASLRPGGMLVVDLFGGWEAQMEITDDTEHDGFTYQWEQEYYDPLTHHTRFHIHFRFHDRGKIRRAFTYDWRLWTMPEVRELLEEAGFASSAVYWEGIDSETGEGNGEYRQVVEAENCPGWNAILVGLR